MQVGDLVIATEGSYYFGEGDIGLLIHIDRGQPDKDYRPLYFVQWNNSSRNPYEYSVNGKRIETFYST